MAARGLQGSILVVDDGSGEAEAAALLEAIRPIRAAYPGLIREPLSLPENLGKGGAVYRGWDSVSPETGPDDLLGFVDADGSTPAAEFCRLWSLLDGDRAMVDGILGCRIRMLGREVDRRLKRHLLGRIFATLTHWATGIKAYDSQCGAKLVKAAVLRKIRNDLRECGFAFDIELILVALQSGFRLVEAPVDWRDVPGSRVRLIRDSWRMLLSLLRIRRRHGSLER